MPPQELWLQRPAPHHQSLPWGGELCYKTTTIGLDKYLHPPPLCQKTLTTGNLCTPLADNQWSSVGNWECLQYHLPRMRRTPPMPLEQRPRPNTGVANCSGSSWNQNRSTANTHSGWNGLEQDRTHRWLKAAGLKAETEDFIIAAQDQNLPTRW